VDSKVGLHRKLTEQANKSVVERPQHPANMTP